MVLEPRSSEALASHNCQKERIRYLRQPLYSQTPRGLVSQAPSSLAARMTWTYWIQSRLPTDLPRAGMATGDPSSIRTDCR